MRLVSVPAAEVPRYEALLERGLAEWRLSSDALIDGVLVEQAPRLVREGLLDGRLELLLMLPVDRGEQEALVVPLQDDANARRGFDLDGAARPGLRQLRDGDEARDGVDSVVAHAGDDIAGYDVVSTFRGRWLQGHQTWIRPELRGKGIWREYADAVLALARERGLLGFFFVSTLPFWRAPAERMGFEVMWRYPQRFGPEAVAYVRRVA